MFIEFHVGVYPLSIHWPSYIQNNSLIEKNVKEQKYQTCIDLLYFGSKDFPKLLSGK